MRIYMMAALVLVSFTQVALANQEAGLESYSRGPLPQALYDLREPETIQARSLADAMRARRLERTAAPASTARSAATITSAPRAAWSVLASAVVPGDPRAAEREAARAAHQNAAVASPTAVFATHIGSDVMPVRPVVSLQRHDSATTTPGTCKRCGEKVAESYAVLCLECRAARASR